ncbi:MAG TPA: hypothetical protein VND22_08255 [Actinomycetota bacterium]|nr:hypothetical protein [Actinomycetota bacterium]
MPLSFAAVMPHGDALIPGLGAPENGHPSLTEAMHTIAAAANQERLDTLVIATPHGVAIDEGHSVAVSDRIAGSVGHIELSATVDKGFSAEILGEAEQEEVDAVGIILQDSDTLPMDWGTLIPAWFFEQAGALPPLVVICPSRGFGVESCAKLGELVAKIAESSTKRVGLVASADNAHAHQEEGPYGFHESARDFDERIVEITRSGAWEDYLTVDQALIESALPDSPWQLAILAGAFRKVPFKPELVVYECPSYFGMMCTLFSRAI